MKSIIDELWYGNICPQESDAFDQPEWKELVSYIKRHEQELMGNMSDAQKGLYEKVMDNHCELISRSETVAFSCGFKLGARFMLEALTEVKTVS